MHGEIWSMELDGEEEKPFIFLPTSFFSLHIFMHSHKVDSEFTSPPLTFSRLILNLFMPLKNIYIYMYPCYIHLEKRDLLISLVSGFFYV